MAYFPLFVNLENKKIIVLGGGKTALRKINSLMKFDCRLAVIAPKICDEIKAIEGISIHEENMTLDVLDNADYVIAATKRSDVNDKIGKYCNEKNIQVNVADNKELSTFLFPGIVMREDLVVGVTTGGNSSNVAKEIRNMIDKLIPLEYGTLTRKMAAYREIADVNIKDSYLRELALDDIIKMAVNNKYILDDRKANKIIDRYAKEDAARSEK
jgi:siroheme synthase-like protein